MNENGQRFASAADAIEAFRTSLFVAAKFNSDELIKQLADQDDVAWRKACGFDLKYHANSLFGLVQELVDTINEIQANETCDKATRVLLEEVKIELNGSIRFARRWLSMISGDVSPRFEGYYEPEDSAELLAAKRNRRLAFDAVRAMSSMLSTLNATYEQELLSRVAELRVSAPTPASRSETLSRGELFLQWHMEDRDAKYPWATIRERWNAMTEPERLRYDKPDTIKNGRSGRDHIEHAVNQAMAKKSKQMKKPTPKLAARRKKT
jgi:hypothetical protein